jgi:hypothetical protein
MRVLKGVNDNSGRVLPFPLSRHAGTVRRVAGSLAVQHGKTADSYWRQMIAGMRGRMVATGIPEEAIEGDLRAFSASVFSKRSDRCALASPPLGSISYLVAVFMNWCIRCSDPAPFATRRAACREMLPRAMSASARHSLTRWLQMGECRSRSASTRE